MNDSLQSYSEQQKNMCFKQNVTMTLYKKWIELFQATKSQETRYPISPGGKLHPG